MILSKKKLIFIFFVLFIPKVYSQEYRMHILNPYSLLSINPATAGNKQYPSAAFFFRNRLGINSQGNSSQFFLVEGSSPNSSFGYGFQAMNDAYLGGGLGFYGAVSYSKILSNDARLAFGVQTGITEFRSYNTFSINTFKTNLGLGLYYQKTNFYAGISVPNVIPNELSGIRLARPIFIMGGGVFKITQDWVIKGTFLYRYQTLYGRNHAFDGGIMAWQKEKYGVGISILGTEAESADQRLLLQAQVQITPQIRAGYGFDFYLQNKGLDNVLGLSTSAFNTQTFMVRVDFQKRLRKNNPIGYF